MYTELVYASPEWLVVEGARASFGKSHKNYTTEQNNGLIKFLAREKHYLPFRHPQITIRCTAPIFVARQLGKHQVGFSWSEESRRYIDSEPNFIKPVLWRKRAKDKKQGSLQEVIAVRFQKMYYKICLWYYKYLLKKEVAPEQARMVLPQSMYTTWVWTGSLLAYWQMYRDRTRDHTQQETMDMVLKIGKIMEECYPTSWKALEDSIV